jgi:hypothetical protein
MKVNTIVCMNTKLENPKPIAFIRELCKHKKENEIQSAEENFRELLLVIKGICDRLEDEGKEPIDYGH